MEREKKVKRSKTLVERANGEAKENGKNADGELLFLRPSPCMHRQGTSSQYQYCYLDLVI